MKIPSTLKEVFYRFDQQRFDLLKKMMTKGIGELLIPAPLMERGFSYFLRKYTSFSAGFSTLMWMNLQW